VSRSGRIRFDDLQWERRYRRWDAYAQSKLADLMMARRLAAVAQERGWPLRSIAAHPGYTMTNLQSAGANLGRARPRLTLATVTGRILPTQLAPQGAEPMLFAATDPGAVNGGYYGPANRFELVGPPAPARVPARARDDAAGVRLWEVAERLTGTTLPAPTA
jgi:NAD(P)-dependent dehydrogenase (short-subunit alcohol dehydrogenase family)